MSPNETAPKLLEALASSHPGVQIATSVRSVSEIVAGVTEGSVDLGLIRCPPADSGLDARTIRREPQGLLVRRDHRLAEGSAAAVADLAGENVLLHPREGPTATPWRSSGSPRARDCLTSFAGSPSAHRLPWR